MNPLFGSLTMPSVEAFLIGWKRLEAYWSQAIYAFDVRSTGMNTIKEKQKTLYNMFGLLYTTYYSQLCQRRYRPWILLYAKQVE